MMRVLFRVVVSAVLVGLLLWGIDAAAVGRGLAATRPGPVILALLLLAGLACLQVVRWRLVLGGLGVTAPTGSLLRILFVGLFFNQTLPSSVGGDPVRMYLLVRTGVATTPAIHSVILDRLVALLGLLLLSLAGLPVLAGLLSPGDPTRLVVPLIALAGFGGVIGLLFLDRLRAWLPRWRVVEMAAALAVDARTVLLSTRRAPALLLLAIFSHAGVAFSAWLLADAAGLDIGPLECLVLVPPVLLVSAVPVTVAGWGVREGAMVFALGLVGVPAAGAFLVSVLLGLVTMSIGLVGGAVWLAGGAGRRDLDEAARLLRRPRPSGADLPPGTAP